MGVNGKNLDMETMKLKEEHMKVVSEVGELAKKGKRKEIKDINL